MRYQIQSRTLQRTKNIVRMPCVPQKLSFCSRLPSSVQLLKAHLIGVNSREHTFLVNFHLYGRGDDCLGECASVCIGMVTRMRDVYGHMNMSPPLKASAITSW